MLSFFSRQPPKPFWQVPPFRTSDPQLLYQHGISCVSRPGGSDGKGMMSTGWALWDMVGLVQLQAKDFLQDGYSEWVSTGANPTERVHFLLEIFHRLRDIHPAVEPAADVWSLPREAAEPASQLYGARCWAGSELLETAPRADLMDRDLDEEIFQAFRNTPFPFMPPRTISQYERMCERRGLPRPSSR